MDPNYVGNGTREAPWAYRDLAEKGEYYYIATTGKVRKRWGARP